MTGGTPDRTNPEYFGGNIKWLVSGDIHQRQIFDCKGRITELGIRNSNARFLPVDSVLIALNGQGKTRGTVAMLRTQATCNQSLVSIAPRDPKILSAEFIYHYLRAKYDGIRRITGDDGNERRGLNMRIIRDIEIPIPPLAEQWQIAAVLDEAFESLRLARSYTEANLQDSKELFVASVDRLLNTNRNGWYSGKFSEIVGPVFTGPFGSLLHKSDYIENETPLVNPENIVEGKIIPNRTKSVAKHILDKLRSYRLEAGDIVIARRGEMGRCAVVEPEQAGWLCGTGSFFVRTQAGTNPKLVAHMLRTPSVVKKLNSIATGATMSNLSNKALANLPMELPNRDVQLALLETIESLDQETRSIAASYNARLLNLNCLRQSLLQRAFTGELT